MKSDLPTVSLVSTITTIAIAASLGALQHLGVVGVSGFPAPAPTPAVDYGPPQFWQNVAGELQLNTLTGCMTQYNGSTVVFTSCPTGVIATERELEARQGIQIPGTAGAGAVVTGIFSGIGGNNAGNIAANQCVAAVNVTVTGAAVGDHISCGTSAPFDTTNCHAEPYVTSANTVQVFYCNVTGALRDCDGAGATFRCASIDW